MAELPISQPLNVDVAVFRATTNMFDDEDGIDFDEELFQETAGDPDPEEGPLTDAQVTQLMASGEPVASPTEASSGTATPRLAINASSGGVNGTASPSESMSAFTPFSSLLAPSEADTESPVAGNRKRYRSKGKPEGYYMASNNKRCRRLENAHQSKMAVTFGVDTFEEAPRSRCKSRALHDRCRKILMRYLTGHGVTDGKGVSAANKQQKRKIFDGMSISEKQKLYNSVVRGETLTAEDKKAMSDFGGFSGRPGPSGGWSKTTDNLPNSKRLNSRAVFVTYQSKKLQLKIKGLAGLEDKDLVQKVKAVPEVTQLCKDLPTAIESLVARNNVDKFSWSLEICLRTYLKDYNELELIRLHIHCCLQRDSAPFRCKTLASSLALGAIKPSHVVGCSDPASGKKCKGSLAMHYYNHMPKKGKICGGTNYKAYEDFLVNPRWVGGYVQRNKMTVEDAKEDPLFWSQSFNWRTYNSARPHRPDPDLNIGGACIPHLSGIAGKIDFSTNSSRKRGGRQ